MTNFSRSLSFTLIDGDEEIEVNNSTIQLLIARDPQTPSPPFVLQNVSSSSSSNITLPTPTANPQFNLHQLDLTIIPINLSFVLHFEVKGVETGVAYLLIYRFDASPQLNSTTRLIDGWTLLCPTGQFSSLSLSSAGLSSRRGHEWFVRHSDRQPSSIDASIVGLRSARAERGGMVEPLSPSFVDIDSSDRRAIPFLLRLFPSGLRRHLSLSGRE